MAWPHVPSEQRGSTGSRTSCHLPPSFALARRYLLRSSAQPDFIEVGISSTTIRLPTPGVLGWINILRTSDQFKNLCKLYCLPTIQLQPVTQVQTHRAAPAMPASPRPMFVLPFFLPLFSISQQSGKREEHPKYSSPGSQQPLTPFPDECEHSSCRNPLSIPLQRPYNLPSVLPCMLLIFLTSTAATQPQSSTHCQSVNDCRKPLLAAPLPLPPLGAGPGA